MANHKPTIDERLDRLTERHEALTQSVELLLRSQSDAKATVESLLKSQTKTETMLAKTETMLAEVVGSINSLARIAHAHEERISGLEDGNPR